jgi:ferredoxin
LEEEAMATITFSPHPRGNAITIEAGGDVGRTLLAVARDHGVPILFNCSGGACGACLVEVASLSPHSAPPLGAEEALLLQALGKLPPATGALIGTAGTATFRLACTYIVPEADLVVRYPCAVGGL